MDLILQLVDIFLHVDEHLAALVFEYGVWVYALLFLIVFCETGLVVTPFLPGDSLLFACGALAAGKAGGEGGLSMFILVPLLISAAIIGDAVNYSIGHRVGPGYLAKGKVRFIKKEHLEKTHSFYEKYGGKTIIIARFVPIVRTFAPFVAGIGKMEYRRFALFNIIGAVVWVLICAYAGFFFGNIPIVQEHFELVILGIIFVSVLPIAVEVLRARYAKKAEVV
ncbi:MAG: DedA family protein [Sandaracinaceae bacterium]|nr:DedA family protein [Sandaracinaceae bacterium]